MVFLTDVSCLSALLLHMLKALNSPLCSSWATPLVWTYVIKHYVMVMKDMVDERVSSLCSFYFYTNAFIFYC